MSRRSGTIFRTFPIIALFLATLCAFAQGNAGAVRGTVTDPSGAVIPGATVHLTNAVSGLDRTTTTDATGQFSFVNVPFNPYEINVSANGFSAISQHVEIRLVLGANLKLSLPVQSASSTVTVEASGDLVEDDPTFHTDVDRDAFIKVPLESQSSTLSSLITLTTQASRPTPTVCFAVSATTQTSDACDRACWDEGQSIGVSLNGCGSQSSISPQKNLPQSLVDQAYEIEPIPSRRGDVAAILQDYLVGSCGGPRHFQPYHDHVNQPGPELAKFA